MPFDFARGEREGGQRAVTMKNTLVEALHVLAGLVAAVAITWTAAWSYPLGWDVIWWCGIGAMVATLVMGIGPLRRAWMQDKAAQ